MANSPLALTGSQTVGPYFAIGLSRLCTDSVHLQSDGPQIEISGHLLDANGLPIPDAFLEIWQADSAGKYNHAVTPATGDKPEGFARVATDRDGQFHFTTQKPGRVPYDGSRLQAPHLLVLIYMRGLLRNLVTRLYFADDPETATDPVLQLVAAERRRTLIALLKPGTANHFAWDIVVRAAEDSGREETVFFAW